MHTQISLQCGIRREESQKSVRHGREGKVVGEGISNDGQGVGWARGGKYIGETVMESK